MDSLQTILSALAQYILGFVVLRNLGSCANRKKLPVSGVSCAVAQDAWSWISRAFPEDNGLRAIPRPIHSQMSWFWDSILV